MSLHKTDVCHSPEHLIAIDSSQKVDPVMTVEFSGSSVTNMNMDDSKIGYKQLFADGSTLRYSIFALRNNPFRLATLCLGVLGVVLLFVVIGQSVHYHNVQQERDNTISGLTKDKDNLQEELKTTKRQNRDLETRYSDMQRSNDYLSTKNNQIQTNNNILQEETNRLKQSQSQLEASNNALTKDKERLQVTNEELQASNDALNTGKGLLEQQYNSVLQRKNELQTSLASVSRERNNLQNKYNNVTRARELLQRDYNTLVKDVEHLQGRYNYSAAEKERLESSHQNLTISKETLQENYDVLLRATDELRASNAALTQEKTELEVSCRNVTLERDQLRVINSNLTSNQSQLQGLVDKLSTDKRCLTGWRRFQNSCFYLSAGKKNWALSREYCRNKGADLAVLKTREQMTYINSIISSDKEYWIGLTDEGVEGQWRWVDGTAMETTFWGKDQPNSYDGRNQDCVEFWYHATSNGSWNDENCNVDQNWICEM